MKNSFTLNHYKGWIFLSILFHVLLIEFLQAQVNEPIIISPLLGDKVDSVERDFFNLFPKIEGFEEAIFYLNSDSSLKVDIRYWDGNTLEDTTISRYRTLSNLQNHIEYFVLSSINDIEESQKGSLANILLLDSSSIDGELINLNQNSLHLYNTNMISRTDNALSGYGFRSINYDDISEIKFSDSLNISPYVFVLGGGVLGIVVANALNKPSSSPTSGNFVRDIQQAVGEGLREGFLTGFVGSLIGSAVGFILSTFLPIYIISEDSFVPPFDATEIEGLRNNTRNENRLPYFIKEER